MTPTLTESRHATVTVVDAEGEDAPAAPHHLVVRVEAPWSVVRHLLLHDAGGVDNDLVRHPDLVVAESGDMQDPSAGVVRLMRLASGRRRIITARQAYDVLLEGGYDEQVAGSILSKAFYATATVRLPATDLSSVLSGAHPARQRPVWPSIIRTELLAVWRSSFPAHVAGWEAGPEPVSRCQHPYLPG